MTEEMLQNQVDEIRHLLETQLRAKGRTLEAQLRKAGRRLPRKIRADAAIVVDATVQIQNPKLARMIDEDAVTRAAENIKTHLQSHDPWERFKDRWLGILGAISAALIFTFIVVVYVLVQRGIV